MKAKSLVLAVVLAAFLCIPGFCGRGGDRPTIGSGSRGAEYRSTRTCSRRAESGAVSAVIERANTSSKHRR